MRLSVRGNYKKTDAFLTRMRLRQQFAKLSHYGPIGVAALTAATPKDSQYTANSWYWFIIDRPGYFSIQWANSYMEDGVSIAAILQYGHGTKNGGYVDGVDYINPAMRDLFQTIANDMWKEVTK